MAIDGIDIPAVWIETPEHGALSLLIELNTKNIEIKFSIVDIRMCRTDGAVRDMIHAKVVARIASELIVHGCSNGIPEMLSRRT